MCGIAGIVNATDRHGRADLAATVRAMTDTIAHRGPDSEGSWLDPAAGVALGHRRLAIRDLSPTGHQPMVSSCGRWVIVYNGEVYSHREIAADLESRGRRMRGSSDTEVIVESIAEHGVTHTVERLIGMFAFAAWDRHEHTLHLVRDRLGIKPLYWTELAGTVLFGSELKALRAVPGWSPTIDRDAVSAYLRHGYIPAPHTIHRDVHKLEPGTIVRFSPGQAPHHSRYWDLRAIAAHGVRNPEAGSDQELLDRLDTLLGDAVERRLVADVPLGALLSGGIDSSLVTALMQERSNRRIQTFSIGFDVAGYDEAPYAKEVARHLGTEHTELYAKPEHALDLVQRLPHFYDEPFADSSQLPTMLVSELTRRHVTVALSGDGGDELFAGYQRYVIGTSRWARVTRTPLPIRRAAGRALLAIPENGFDLAARLLPQRRRPDHLGRKIHKVARSLGADGDDMYLQMLSQWDQPDAIVRGGHEPHGVLWDRSLRDDLPDLLDRMQLEDSVTYLPDDILTKVDRASMAYALEARVPLLDHRVVELAWHLPQTMKVRDGQAKWALRRILERRVPNELIDRPKMGFGVPIDHWMRGPLRDWCEHLLDPTRLESQGLLDPEPIRERWQQHLAGANWAYPLWTVLMLQAWMDETLGSTGGR